MNATVTCSQGSTLFSYDGSESGLWENVGKLLKWVKRPDKLLIQSNGQLAELELSDEGIKVISNRIQTSPSRYEKKYLSIVDPETNGYSFYKIIPYNMGPRTLSIGGSFGRIGARKEDLSAETVIRSPYPSFLYWLRYYEKLNKGYQDLGDVMFQEDSAINDMFSRAENELLSEDVITQLYNRLRQFSKNAVSSQINADFLSENPPFTKKQVEKGWKIWKSLGESKNVDDFNKKLSTLLALSPRRVDPYHGMTLKSLYAAVGKDAEDQQRIFSAIIEREESLLQAMEAVVIMEPGKKGAKDKTANPFGSIEISLASEEERGRVENLLDPGIRKHVKTVYQVQPIEQEKKFRDYVQKRNIQDTRLFWHGSRNENWISIIKNSLMLNPNAIITGKMFGSGIYFAPSSQKSWGYTSFAGARWTGGTESCAYMGLYAVAYGTPYFPDRQVKASKEFLDQNHADCLHAKANTCSLRNDEVVFFDEDAVCLKYLVEFDG